MEGDIGVEQRFPSESNYEARVCLSIYGVVERMAKDQRTGQGSLRHYPSKGTSSH
jgi:hypothetical protein